MVKKVTFVSFRGSGHPNYWWDILCCWHWCRF